MHHQDALNDTLAVRNKPISKCIHKFYMHIIIIIYL